MIQAKLIANRQQLEEMMMNLLVTMDGVRKEDVKVEWKFEIDYEAGEVPELELILTYEEGD